MPGMQQPELPAQKIKVMTEEYMEEHLDELNWDEVCLYQKLSVDFIKKHIKHIDFNKLSVNPFITFEILDTFSNKISWASISINGKGLSESMMYNYRNKLEWTLVLNHQQLALKFLIIMSEVMRKSRAKASKGFWRAVSRFQQVDATYVNAYKRYIDFTELSKNPYLTDDIIIKFLDRLDIPTLFKYQKLSKPILEKFQKEFRNAMHMNQPTNK